MPIPVGCGFTLFSAYPLLGACLLTTYAHKRIRLLTRVYGSQIAVFESKCACRLEFKWSQDKSIRKVFICFVCVCVDDVIRLGVELGEEANFYFS